MQNSFPDDDYTTSTQEREIDLNMEIDIDADNPHKHITVRELYSSQGKIVVSDDENDDVIQEPSYTNANGLISPPMDQLLYYRNGNIEFWPEGCVFSFFIFSKSVKYDKSEIRQISMTTSHHKSQIPKLSFIQFKS